MVTGRRLQMLAALVALSWLGCAGSPPPQDSFHRIPVARPEARPAPILEGNVEVERLTAPDLLQLRPVVFVRPAQPDLLLQHDYHYWSEAPPVMLQQRLVGYLRNAGLAGGVLTPDLRVPADHAITGRLHRFERVVDGAATRVEVALELVVRQRDGRSVRWHRLYEDSEAAGSARVSDSASAFGRAVSRIFGQFAEDLAGLPGDAD